jgi:DNA-binding MarR family transcriptional regulator
MSQNEIEKNTSYSGRTIYLLKQVEVVIKIRVDQKLRDFQLTGGQYAVLSLVNRPELLSSAQIARRFFVTPQSANEVVFTLEKKQLIERHEDPDNRRILRVRLTEVGRELLAACDKTVDELETDFLKGLDESEIYALRQTLKKIVQSLGEKNED